MEREDEEVVWRSNRLDHSENWVVARESQHSIAAGLLNIGLPASSVWSNAWWLSSLRFPTRLSRLLTVFGRFIVASARIWRMRSRLLSHRPLVRTFRVVKPLETSRRIHRRWCRHCDEALGFIVGSSFKKAL